MELEPKQAQEIGRKVFPAYAGRKYSLQVREPGMSLTSYWDGGSRSYYRVVRLSDMQAVEVPQNGSGFDGHGYGFTNEQLPQPGLMVVEHAIFCGKDFGLTFHVHQENAAKFLPADSAVTLTWEQRVVLTATRSLKSSYGGIKNFRFVQANDETGITLAQWEQAKGELIAAKLLNAAGAITVTGSNAAKDRDLWSLGKERKEVAA